MNENTIKEYCKFVDENYGTELVQDPGSEYTTEELVMGIITSIFDYHAERLCEQLKETQKAGGSEEASATFKNDYISITASIRENDENTAIEIEALQGLKED